MAHKLERSDHRMKNVTEIPIGDYDAVRTLRAALQQAESGDIKTVIIICTDGLDEENAHPDGVDLWASWSDMTREQVLWMQRWFNSWLNKRYFGNFHSDD